MAVVRSCWLIILSSLLWTSSQAKDLALGFVAPLTGPAAIYGQQAMAGAQAYLDGVNKAGGVNGHRLRLVVADDAFKADATVAHVRRLIQDDHVVAFVSGAGAANWDAVVKAGVLQDNYVPAVGVITAASLTRQPTHHNLFFLRPTIREEVERIFRQAGSMGMNRIAIL